MDSIGTGDPKQPEWKKPSSTTGLSCALDIFNGGYHCSKQEALDLLTQAQSELAALDPEHDIRGEAVAAFEREQNRNPGSLLFTHEKLIRDGYRPTVEDMALTEAGDQEKITRLMAKRIIETADPRVSKRFMDEYYAELNRRTQDYLSNRPAEKTA